MPPHDDSAAWNDEPVVNAAHDEFNRASIAAHIADLVASNHSTTASRVYGLTGPWGAGKSSMINMVCEALEAGDEGDKRSRWVIARFTPWATGTADALLLEFHTAVAVALEGHGTASGQARRALSACLTAAAPFLKLVPVSGDAISSAAEAASQLLSRQPPWKDAFEQFTAKLGRLNIQLLVVADDIDRLQPAELVALLKVVRLLGRFPGVDYLLAYDERTLFSNLTNANVGAASHERARLFMEKIVQYPIGLPPLLRHQIERRLNAGLLSVLDGRGGANETDQRLADLAEIFVRQLATPRSIDRYVAQANFIVPMHDERETDDIDLLLLTFVHMQFPTVYARLPQWHAPLTGRRSTLDVFDAGRDAKSDFTALFEGLDPAEEADARRVLRAIFPPLDGGSSRNGPYASHYNYFSRYFVHIIPDNDISDATIREALDEANDSTSDYPLLASLLTDITFRERPALALSKLRTHSAPEPDEPSRVSASLALVAAVAHLAPSLSDETGIFLSPRDSAVTWLTELILRLPTGTTQEELLQALSSCASLEVIARVLWNVASVADDATNAALVSAAHAAANQFAREVVNYCLAHLNQRQDAEPDERVTFPLMFAARFSEPEALRAAIRENLADGAFTIADLAARCVTLLVRRGSPPRYRLSEFDAELFAFLAPLDDPFYDLQREPTNESDTSWRGRERFARGRARRPAKYAKRYPN